MRRKKDDGPARNLIQFLYEHRSFGLQRADDCQIVDNWPSHVNRRAMGGERIPDRIDRSAHAGAEASRSCKQHMERRLLCRIAHYFFVTKTAGCMHLEHRIPRYSPLYRKLIGDASEIHMT